MDVPLIHTPNLAMQPASTGGSVEQLIANVKDGYAVFGSTLLVDQQALTGRAHGQLVYRVKNGKRVGTVDHLAILFRSREFWKNLAAVGDASTVRTIGAAATKGQPAQSTSHSVSAPAVYVRDVTVVTT
jgi:predicted Zn-dependent protease